MNSHSPIKRPKPPNLNETDHHLTKLHDSLIIQILSFLPEPDATRTRILSKRLHHLYSFLPNLHFVMPFCWTLQQNNTFHDSVDQTLSVRDRTPINKFYLYCSKNFQEIELRFPNDRSCRSLVSLSLRGEFVLNVPDGCDVLFPCLKRMNLVSIVYAGDDCFKNLVSGCPVLEELFVERQLIGEFDNMVRCVVVSPSLKRLVLSFALYVSGDFRVVIDARKLEYVSVMDVMSTGYEMTAPLSLVEAHWKVRSDLVDDSAAQLVTSLSNVKVLTLVDSTLMAFSDVQDLDMPVFRNLVDFFIGLDVFRGWSMLPTFLNKMPNLEHITFLDGFLPFPHAQHNFTMRWNQPVEVPACLRCKMKKIIIKNRETITPAEVKFIRYLLKHGNRLEILTINAHKIDSKRRGQVLKLHRGSKSCRIEFV
ncbi:hypothetical protein M8C21_018677 [Ambrosia artemisiifolia]|uniref:FBD domain-containing protein n=1 Tax=Ambrosia artemisiifolia TaxID=4212 RepID=A0AAD5C416_AMBAR|nr:hypothetical protein M8C21_018677 [Ambrosia artemisiifolia]